VSSLQHGQIVDLLKAKHSSIKIVAVRSVADHRLMSSQSMPSRCDAGSSVMPLRATVDKSRSNAAVAEVRVNGGESVDDMSDQLLLIRQMVRGSLGSSDIKRTNTCNHVSSSTTSLPAMPTLRDRRTTRKTASFIHSVTLPAPTTEGNVDKQTLSGTTSSSSTVPTCSSTVPLSFSSSTAETSADDSRQQTEVGHAFCLSLSSLL